jgi:hypothetical protein
MGRLDEELLKARLADLAASSLRLYACVAWTTWWGGVHGLATLSAAIVVNSAPSLLMRGMGTRAGVGLDGNVSSPSDTDDDEIRLDELDEKGMDCLDCLEAAP